METVGEGHDKLTQEASPQGAQILELEELANHRGSLLGALPGQRQRTRKMFDSLLLDAMRKLDPGRVV